MAGTGAQLPVQEVALVRELAGQVMAIAQEPRMAAILQRWRDVNALRVPDRAPVWCRPVGCWRELLPPEALGCRHPWLRGVEYGFRQLLLKRAIDDDTPVEASFAVPVAFDVDPPNWWGVEVKRHASAATGGAWAYDPPLKTDADFDRLVLPRVTVNAGETQRRLEQAAELFAGIMPVRQVCTPPLGATLGTPAADLRGLAPLMLDMLDAPELLHRLMAFLRDAAMGVLDQVEALGLITPNTADPMTCSDPLAPPSPAGTYSLQHCWGMANSQEFDQVSAAMWEEFCLDYQRPLLARYGLVGYGCCENLTCKLDGVFSLPNLRIITCSAWTNLERVIERAGTDYCIMWRQKASDVVFPDDLATIRQGLEAGLERLRGCRYQIVLRELETLAGHPDRLSEWTRLAKELAARYA
jgi:hypothetical protein